MTYPRGDCKVCVRAGVKAARAANLPIYKARAAAKFQRSKGTDQYRAETRRRNFKRRAGSPGPVQLPPGSACVYCDAPAVEVDHIWPLARGGTNAPDNLAPACFDCNRSKGAKTLAEWLGFTEPE